MIRAVLRIFKGILSGRDGEGRERGFKEAREGAGSSEEDGATEVRDEVIRRALDVIGEQLDVEKLVEEARKDLTSALNRVTEYFGLEKLVVLDDSGKPIGIVGDGRMEGGLINAVYTIRESLGDVDTILVTSEDSTNYLALCLDEYVVVCESKMTLSDADIFMLKNDLGKVIDAAVSGQRVKSEIPFVVIDEHGLVILSNVDRCEEVGALISQLYRFVKDHVEGSIEWIKMTTGENKTLAVKPHNDFLIAFVVESDVEDADDACEETVKTLIEKVERAVAGSPSPPAEKGEGLT
ncbi:hypothetical protein [Methanopyrus kandleri]|uniref:Uncharacterized protein n=1 Tax=Methanopyrus kandleri TaxID=2320 RepID=A0A832WL09_9EURY|nr:hypothetical protein [Methanopyrus kandleri]HII70640.1 hypothetical protein [Methanopyrus kandleri]